MLSIFILGLVLSGVTAIPLETELRLLAQLPGIDNAAQQPGISNWVLKVRNALIDTNATYPFIAYGTDWLAFGHFVIAIAFIGPWRDPVKNTWVVEFGMIACLLVVPFALVMGGVRGIPVGWRLIDCSFGVLGIIPLWYCRRLIMHLAEDAPAGTQPTNDAFTSHYKVYPAQGWVGLKSVANAYHQCFLEYSTGFS